MVALNRFAYFTRQYQGFDPFKVECLRLMRLFGDLYCIRRLTRFGLRYVNLIPCVKEDGLLPVEQFLVLGRHLRSLFPQGLRALSTGFVMPWPEGEGVITVNVGPVTGLQQGQEALRLDFDCASDREGLQLGALESYMIEAHEISNTVFSAMITPEYGDYIEGEVL